jgi:hypothetical protein
MHNFLKVLEERISEIVEILNSKPTEKSVDKCLNESSIKKEPINDSYMKFKAVNGIEDEHVIWMISEMKIKVRV